jgi:hypothetical protein
VASPSGLSAEDNDTTLGFSGFDDDNYDYNEFQLQDQESEESRRERLTSYFTVTPMMNGRMRKGSQKKSAISRRPIAWWRLSEMFKAIAKVDIRTRWTHNQKLGRNALSLRFALLLKVFT